MSWRYSSSTETKLWSFQVRAPVNSEGWWKYSKTRLRWYLQNSKFNKPRWILHLRWVNFMLCKLHLHKVKNPLCASLSWVSVICNPRSWDKYTVLLARVWTEEIFVWWEMTRQMVKHQKGSLWVLRLIITVHFLIYLLTRLWAHEI